MQLIPEMTFHLHVRGPLGSTQGASSGEVVYWEMTSGTLDGERIKAKIAAPGSDWMAASPDGFWRPDVRIPFLTDDGALVLLRYTGLVQQTAAFKKASEDGASTAWGAQYMRMAMHFEAGAPQYAWLNQHLFVAEGRLAGKNKIDYRIYRVT